MRIFKQDPSFQFMNKRLYAFIISGLIIAVGVFLFFTRGFNLGIDFTGGTKIEVSFNNDTSENDLRDALKAVGLEKSMIQRVGVNENKFFLKTFKAIGTEGAESENEEEDENGAKKGVTKLVEEALMSKAEKSTNAGKLDINNSSNQGIVNLLVSNGVPRDTAEDSAAKLVSLRTEKSTGLINNDSELDALGLNNQVQSILTEKAYFGHFTFLSVEMVGPQVGHDLRQKATLATVWAMIGMLIYIGFRFRFIFGIAAVITLLHDVLLSLTMILAFQIEVSLHVVAGILTIVGYSLNDTIVIFDRVRDNLKLMKRQEAEIILDSSINQTLSRTIVTSGTTLATVFALFFFGGEVIHSFSFTLLVGIFIGTYSSIFQSCAWLKIWEGNFIGRKKK
jgi:preprotein translocase subunit SecF